MGTIIVCGAGLTGLSMALALKKQGQSVTLLAPRLTQPITESAHYDPRVYAISPASQQFLTDLGIWESLPVERIIAVQKMEIYGDESGKVNLNAASNGGLSLAWIVESNAIERVFKQAINLYRIPWLDDRALHFKNDLLFTEKGQSLEAELFIGADGATSVLRAAAGLAQKAIAYDDIGLITHLNAQLPHRNTAFQWFIDQGILALLPMPDSEQGSQVSMVWSTSQANAHALRVLPVQEQAKQLSHRLTYITQARLGQLTVCSSILGFPLFLERASLIAPKIALVGDAAHRFHPLAGQGLNMGLGDVKALTQAIVNREPYRSVGDLRVLRRYQRARVQPLWAMQWATDGLHKLFGTHATPLVWLRNSGMRWVNASSWIKRQLINAASGF